MGIEQYLQQILSARYGRDVRQSIHDSIYEINEIAKQAEYDASTAPESAKAYAQAALASERAAEDYKTAAEQAAQQAMSGTPEGYADLVAKVNSIYRQTATSYNVVGTSEGSALAHTIYGMSVQDGTPTPSVPVEIQSAKADFRCVGKNLLSLAQATIDVETPVTNNGVTYILHKDGHITVTGRNTSSSTVWFPFIGNSNPLKLPKQGSYSIYCKVVDRKGTVVGDNTNINFIFYAPNSSSGIYRVWANSTTWGSNASAIRPVGEGYTMTLFTRIGADVEVDVDYYPIIMLGSNDENEPVYYPPQHTDVTTDLTLRAIEVASTDDYTYERDGKYYIADTVDWSEDEGYKITRRVKEITINSIPNISSLPRYGMISTNTIGPNEFKLPSSQNIRPNAVMTHFATSTIQELIDNDGRFYFNPANGGHVFIRNDNMTSLADWNAWLSENSVKFQGILLNQTTESITSEQAQALLSLKTYNEATSISATGDIEPSVDLEYSKDRNTALALTGHNLGFKNALKLNDINTALIELGGN